MAEKKMDLLKDRLVKGYELGRDLVVMTMDRGEILRMIDLIDKDNEPAGTQEYMKGYEAGFEMGYKRAVVEVVKRVKGMKWYGGNKKINTAEVPGDHPGRAADMQ